MYRNICFTSYDVDSKLELVDPINYLIYQLEECPKTHKRHYQGYAEFTTPCRLKKIKELLGKGVHVEPRRGTQEQAIAYCSKSESRIEGPWELGRKKVGHRNSTASLTEAIGLLQKSGLSAVAREFPAAIVRNGRGLQLLSSLIEYRRDFKTHVTIICGPSGSGKSRLAHEMLTNPYPKSNDQWWDGYHPTQDVIWDDVDWNCIPYQEFLRLMDRYPLQVRVKGSTVWFSPKRIIFTCIELPDFDEQFYRRIDETINMNEKSPLSTNNDPPLIANEFREFINADLFS